MPDAAFDENWLILTTGTTHQRNYEGDHRKMREMKDSAVSSVRIGYDGLVHKRYRGPLARERYENEVRVLRHLEAKGCDFVPRVLEEHPADLYLVTSNSGRIFTRIGEDKMNELFDELERYGVRHDDRAARNVTYNPRTGRFCLIDFEFALITETGQGLLLEQAEKAAREARRHPR